MKFFFAGKDIKTSFPETQEALRQALLQRFPHSRLDNVFSLAYDRDGQFFLKTEGEILWARILNENLKEEHFRQIALEWEHYRMTFRQTVKLCLFFPGFAEKEGRLPEKWEQASFFQYSVFSSPEGVAALLKEWGEEGAQLPRMESSVSVYQQPLCPESSEARRGRLSRDEISELMELSLDLKRCSAS